MKLNLAKKWHFWHGEMPFLTFAPKIRHRMLQNAILSSETAKTHPNYPQTKGFVLKHHQNDFKQLFWKVKILHFFQNFNFQKWEFSFWFSTGNESWKFQKLNFAKKSRFSDREVIFRQTLLVSSPFGCVFSVSELRIAFWSILWRIFGAKVKMAFSHAKNAIFS